MVKIPVVGTTVKIDLDKGERGWANKDIQHGSVVKVVEYGLACFIIHTDV